MRRPLFALAVFLSTGGLGHAQGLQAVRSMPGYVCMQLAPSPGVDPDPTKRAWAGCPPVALETGSSMEPAGAQAGVS